MNNTLHILNGDATLWALDKAGIDGERLVWRDVLCEGPVISNFASPDFWEKRTGFMSDFFGADPKDFKEKCIDEFDKIKDFARYEELVLWFEYDLFCQINMLGILHFLSAPIDEEMKISLICVGSEKGSKKLLGLGEIPPENFKNLYEDRVSLQMNDLKYASSMFLAYCHKAPQELTKKHQDHAKFPYLKGAIAAHLKRFPFKTSGLNEIEMTILHFLKQGASEPKDIVRKMLSWQKSTFYGFGDAQYFVYLKMLQPLYDDNFELNELGNKVVSGTQSAKGIISRDYQLGGVTVAEYVWDADKKELALFAH